MPLRDPETVTPAMMDNLIETRGSYGPDSCPCQLAISCPLHWCECWRYRMPWECDCEDDRPDAVVG